MITDSGRRLATEECLEFKYLNKNVKYRTLKNKYLYGKIDRISYDYSKSGHLEVIFILNRTLYVSDLDYFQENTEIL